MPTVGSLTVELRAEIAQFKANLDDSRRSLGNIESAAAGALSGIKNLVAGYLSLQGAIRATRAVVDATLEVEKANLRLEAVVRATGSAAGWSAGELKDYADALARSSLFNSEEIKAAEAELSIFRNVHGETFKQVIKMAMDLSTLTGQDLLSSTRNLGRALNDPINGYTMLGKSIGRLSPIVQQEIKDAAAAGDSEKARAIMITELSKTLGGGVAGGTAGGLAGALHAVNEGWTEWLGHLGETSGVLDPVIAHLREVARWLNAIRDAQKYAQEPGVGLARELQGYLNERELLGTTRGGGEYSQGLHRRLTPEEIPARLAELNRKIAEAQAKMEATRQAGLVPGPEKYQLPAPWPGAYEGKAPTWEADTASAKKRQDAITAIMEALRKEADTTGMTTAQIKLYELAQLGASAADRKRATTLAMLADIGDTRKDALRAAADAGTFQLDLQPELRTQAEQIRDFWSKHGALAQQLGVPVGKPDDMSVFMHNMGLPSAKDLQDEAARMKANKGPDLYATAWKEAIRGIQQTFADFYASIFTATNNLRDLIVNMLNAIKTAAANLLATLTTNALGGLLHLPGMGGGGGGILPAPSEAPVFAMPTSRLVGAPRATGMSPSVVNVYMTNHLNANSFDPHTGAKLLQAQAGTLMGIWYKGMQDMGIPLGRRA